MIEKKKREIRKELSKRKSLYPDTWIAAESQKVLQLIQDHKEYEEAKIIFSYVNMEREVSTLPLIRKALDEGKRVGVPLCLGPGTMEIREIKSVHDLEAGIYGILEPKPYTRIIQPEMVEYAIIPCVSCDRNGRRLGHGAGYYDRYLENSTFTKVALCFEEWMMDEIPTTTMDVWMDYVVTQNEMIQISKL